MKRRARARHLISMLGLLSGLAVGTDACLQPAEIMLVITTDLVPGSDIDLITIEVEDGEVSRIVLTGDSAGELPAVLGIVPQGPDAPKIDVIAWRYGKPDNLEILRRSVRPRFSPYGIQELPVHLPFLCEAGAELCQKTDGVVCGNDGDCAPDNEQPLEEQPAEGTFADASCLDPIDCFEGVASLAVLDLEKCLLLDPTEGVNVALLTAFPTVVVNNVPTVQKGSGFCDSNLCYILLDNTALSDPNPDDGISEHTQLPTNVCAQIGSGKLLGVVTAPITAACPEKKLQTILQGPWSHQCPGDPPADFASAWQSAGNLSPPRSLHATVLLDNGDVMVTGGADTSNGNALKTVGIRHSSSGSWGSKPLLTTQRAAHTATHTYRWPGQEEIVLVAGGTENVVSKGPMPSSQVYDVEASSFGGEISMLEARSYHEAIDVQMGGGEHAVLLTGGVDSQRNARKTSERFRTSTLTFENGPEMNVPRVGLTMTQLNDEDGSVLVVGGGSALQGKSLVQPTDSVDIYSPLDNSFSEGESLRDARGFHTATRLDDGRVLVAGGQDQSNAPLDSVEIYSPNTKTWECAPPMSFARYKHTATLITGRVLVVGGVTLQGTSAPAEIYDPDENTWTLLGVPDLVPRVGHTATPLPTGVLLSGGAGLDPSGDPQNPTAIGFPSTWLFNLGSFTPTKASTDTGCGGSESGSGGSNDEWKPTAPEEIHFHGSGCAASPGARQIACQFPSSPSPAGATPWALFLLALAARRRRPS